MAFARDTYYAALYEHLQANVKGITTWSRRHLQFSRVPAAAQPACLVLAANQNCYQEPGCPTVWTLGADIVIWVRASNQEDSLDTVLNELLDEVERVLLRGSTDTIPSGRQATTLTTLGGILQSMNFAGPWDINQREGAEEASVVIPIDMVVLGDNPGSS